MTQLLEILHQTRTLIIFDDVQYLLQTCTVAGHYKPETQPYQTLFKRIGEIKHNSCVLLLSWEKPLEVSQLEQPSTPVKSLEIGSLGQAAIAIFQNYHLQHPDQWPNLIDRYQGNPLWLTHIAQTIQTLFQGVDVRSHNLLMNNDFIAVYFYIIRIIKYINEFV